MTTVVLSGRPGGTTHREVELLASLPAEFRLIGGLAVMCRVGVPHRTTVDLDVVTRDLSRHHDTVDRLAVTSTAGGQYSFDGGLELDVIDVAPVPAHDLLAELGGATTDLELNVVAHTWAHDTATSLDIVAVDDETHQQLSSARDRLVATPGGLVAMKVTTIPLRASSRPEKRASDLYDLGRLVTVAPVTAADVDAMPSPVAAAVRDRLRAWFVDGAGRDRTYREVRRFDEPHLDLDDVADAVDDLVAG